MSAVDSVMNDIELAEGTTAETHGTEDPDEHYESDPDEHELCDCVDHDDDEDTSGMLCCGELNIENITVRIIPYSAVYEDNGKCLERGLFMPGHPVRALITAVERDATGTHNLFNPYLCVCSL